MGPFAFFVAVNLLYKYFVTTPPGFVYYMCCCWAVYVLPVGRANAAVILQDNDRENTTKEYSVHNLSTSFALVPVINSAHLSLVFEISNRQDHGSPKAQKSDEYERIG